MPIRPTGNPIQNTQENHEKNMHKLRKHIDFKEQFLTNKNVYAFSRARGAENNNHGVYTRHITYKLNYELQPTDGE